MEAISTKARFSFLQSSGEMGSLTRNYNWSQTSIGDAAQWPQSLRTTVSIILNSKFPMFLWWGTDLVQFYNDAYRPSLGNNGKHPTALGQKGEECWPEIWPIIKPMIDQVRNGGDAIWSEDQLIPIYRNGGLEDVYWTFSYTPVNDEDGGVGGVLVVCTETTNKVKTIANLRLSDNRFQNLVRGASVGIILLTGEEMRVDLVNDSYGRLIDRMPEELMGKPLFSIIPETEQIFRPIIDGVRISGEPLYLYGQPFHVYVHGEIKEGYLDVVCQPYKEADGTISGVMVLCHEVTQTVFARKKIEESEQHVRSIIESAPFPIGVYTGREMRIQFANQSILEIWGKGDKVVGKLFSDILPELNNQEIFNQLDSVYTSGVPFHAKNQRVDLIVNGKPKSYYFNYSFTPLFDVVGKVYGLMNTATDVTALNHAKQKSEESEQNLRNIILQAPVAMCILRGPEHVVEIANDLMFELWGKELEELIGKPIFEGLPEAKGQGLEDLLDNVYTKGETYKAHGVAVMLPRENGSETVYIDFVYEAFRDADNTISGVMAVASDVTEQVKASKKIAISEARFRLMADAMPQFVWTADVNGNLNYYNQAVYAYSGLSYEQIQTDGWLQIVHPDDRKENIKLWLAAMQTGENFIFQHRFKNSAGNYRWQLSRAVPQRDSDGVIQLWIGTSTDIHEQKLFEEELARQVQQRTEDLGAMNVELNVINQEFSVTNQQLVRSNEELEQFTYAASHDMQEPLRKVHTFTTFLLDNHAAQLDERGKTYLTKIGTSVHRMKNIIDDLLNYSHQTREEQQFEAVDLAKIIEDVEADLELVIQQKRATIVKDELIEINAVPTQMTQLFFNLFSNALKFSKPDVPVKIEITSEYLTAHNLPHGRELLSNKLYTKISFCDNGIGFNQQHAEQIFSLFKRLHGKAEYEGTGIGLGLCKKIVHNHQGVIWAESEEGRGARFYIVLPV